MVNINHLENEQERNFGEGFYPLFKAAFYFWVIVGAIAWFLIG